MEIIGTTYSTSDYHLYEQTGNKNIFEEVIDKLFLSGFHPEIKNKIESLPLSEKRLLILSLIEEDRSSFLKLRDIIQNNSFDKKEYSTEIARMLREYVKVAPTERRNFGEVMSPTDLITDILNKLPRNVWSNPNLNGLMPVMELDHFYVW